MFKNSVASCVACLFLSSLALQAQAQEDVFAVPGANSTGTTVQVFSSNPFSNITGFTAGAGTFLILAKPDGSKFYAIANSGSSTVSVVSNNFTNPRSISNLGTQATAAAISEDGKRLAVTAGSLHIFDTSSDSDLVPNGINIGASVTAFDVAPSLDGKSFFVLGSNTSGGSVLAAVDASSTVVTASLPITGPTIAVAVGPNGLIYVSAPNQILEINPNTFKATSSAIVVNAKPGKLVFTPDGLYALAVNQTPITGSAVLEVGLTSHAVVNTVPNFGVPLDQLKVLNSTNVLAYSVQNQSLYQITLSSNGNLSINAFTLPGISSSSSITGFTVSGEVPSATRATPQSLYAAVNGIIYREDLPSTTVTGQFPLPSPVGGLSFAGAATSGTSPTTLLQYGNNQTISPNAVSLPVVVRVLDNTGNPISGTIVTFGSNNGAASVSPSSATTGINGYAVTYVTAPAASGPFTVTAMAGNQTVAYSLTVGNGGGTPNSAGIVIIAGQGQILYSNFSTLNAGSPLIVQVNDTSGNPLSGVPVTFAVSQGPGTINALGSQAGTVPNSIIVNTDNTGQAAAQFTASSIGMNGTNYASTTVVASAPNAGSVNFYLTTTPGQGTAAQIAPIPTPGAASVFSGPAGSTIPGAIVVRVTSISGNPIPNVGISINGGTASSPSAVCNNPTGTGVLTDATGTATCDLVLNGVVGAGSFTLNVGYFETFSPYYLNIVAGPPGLAKILQGNNQTGTPGQKLPQALLVQITDAFGNALPGVPVAWSVVTPGTVVLSNISSATDSSGRASAIATLGTTAGNAQVKVTAGNVSATFTLTVNIPSAGIQKVSGDAQTTLVSTAFAAPLVVQVVDASTPPKPVSGATVTFAVTSGTATLGSASTITDTNGQASTTVTAGATAGPIVVTATSSTFSVGFNLTARLPGPTNVTFANAASFIAGPVSPGEIVLISGTGIAPGVQGLVTAYNILGQPQPSLAGISISINGVTAPIYYVLTSAGQPDQVVVQVPFETQPGSANVVINSAGGGSGNFTVQVQLYAPGVFQTTVGGQTIAVALRPDGSYVSPSNPAHPGETILVYATGLGQVNPATATGDAGVPGQSVAGVYAIALQIPADAQTGAAQPLGVVVFDAAGNPYFAQGVAVPIQ
jgi:uncharacterized protein (TIGR03437 family)